MPAHRAETIAGGGGRTSAWMVLPLALLLVSASSLCYASPSNKRMAFLPRPPSSFALSRPSHLPRACRKSPQLNMRLNEPSPLHAASLANIDQQGLAVADKDAWILNLDHEAFKREVNDLGIRLERQQGTADVEHIQKICRWSNGCGILGLLTMWLPINPFTTIALSLWTFSRWTTIAHHTGHGGYNRADKTKYFNSRGFAQGTLLKRVTEWFDWMLPEAWNIEHNNLHHYRLGEKYDPDLVERNLEYLRDLKVPMPLKYVISFVMMCTWKWFYYAPNTFKELKIQERKKLKLPVTDEMMPDEPFTLKAFADAAVLPKGQQPTAFMWYSFPELMTQVLGPYLLGHFFLMPLPCLLLGIPAYINAVISLLLAELLTNLHSFIVIATNHAGNDLYKFESGCSPNTGTFFMRQVVGSANFQTGGDVNDFMHGWLNYQIEHHVWPSLSALSYQKGQPELKRICDRHGVPYIQESVWNRLQKTLDIMVGLSDQRIFPPALEKRSDLKVWSNEDTAKNSARLGQDVKVKVPGTAAQ